MIIPKSFKIFGSTIKVEKQKNEECTKVRATGRIVYPEDLLQLTDKDQGFPLSKAEIEASYMHEVFHLVLKRTGYEKLSNDEGFVSLVSRALHQVLSTQEGELKI